MKHYRLQISNHHSHQLWADNRTEAKEKAWDEIKDHYRYGWNTKEEFLNRVKIEEID